MFDQDGVPLVGGVAQTLFGNWHENGFQFVPLVNSLWGLIASVDVMMLRHGDHGYVDRIPDMDNRLKTLFDALRKPDSAAEIGTAKPEHDETPFYVLMQDDKLITRAAIETDTLLQQVEPSEWEHMRVEGEQYAPENFVRLVVSVTVRPYYVTLENVSFSGA
jgi:hypothetical protein